MGEHLNAKPLLTNKDLDANNNDGLSFNDDDSEDSSDIKIDEDGENQSDASSKKGKTTTSIERIIQSSHEDMLAIQKS